MAQTLIQVKDLKKYYNGGDVKALDGVTVDIHKGDVMAVIGPSGGGKSTFLRSLNLLETAEKLQKKQAQEEAASADPEIDALVAARTAAKKAKNYAEADRIRDELKARGIEIIDTPQGAKWRKV